MQEGGLLGLLQLIAGLGLKFAFVKNDGIKGTNDSGV